MSNIQILLLYPGLRGFRHERAASYWGLKLDDVTMLSVFPSRHTTFLLVWHKAGSGTKYYTCAGKCIHLCIQLIASEDISSLGLKQKYTPLLISSYVCMQTRPNADWGVRERFGRWVGRSARRRWASESRLCSGPCFPWRVCTGHQGSESASSWLHPDWIEACMTSPTVRRRIGLASRLTSQALVSPDQWKSSGELWQYRLPRNLFQQDNFIFVFFFQKGKLYLTYI